MPRLTWSVRAGILALTSAAFLGACSDDRTPTKSLTPDEQPAFAISVSSSNFQQCANGGSGGVACFYINGVLNDSKSLYHESDVIAERFVIPGLVAGQTYQLVFDYGWEKAVNPGHMNYDFLAGWNTTLGTLANPCGDPLGNGSSDIRNVCTATGDVKATHTKATYVIPDAVFTTNAPLGLSTELAAAIDRFQSVRGNDAVRFDILGGTFPGNAVDNVTYTVNGDDVTGRITVRFTAAQTTVMLLWGGHFADSRDYRLALWDDDKNGATPEHTDNLTGAAGQSGAPFHFTQQTIQQLPNGAITGIGSLSNNVQGSVLEPVPTARISMVSGATNSVGEAHTFLVTVQQDLDDGQGIRPVTDAHVTVTLTPTNGATPVVDAAASTCDDAGDNLDANGQCTITFNSSTAGTVTGTASVTLSLNGTTVTLSTDGSGDNSPPPVKVFVAGTLRWLKHDGNATRLGGAVFTVCRTERWDSDLNSGAGGYVDITPDVCIDVTDNISGTDNPTGAPPADRDGTAGEFEVGGLILGKYTISEKTPPSGYILDTGTRLAELSTSSPSASFTTAFRNLNPDAFITIGPATATNDVGQSHTFTAVMTAIPNGGTPVSIADFTITVSPAPSTPGSTTCDTFDAATNSKTCRRTINSSTAGTFTANATATAVVAGVSLTRDTDPATGTSAGPGGSGSAVKTYVAPLLAITKTPDRVGDAGYTVNAGGTATFTITVTNTGSGVANNVVIKDTLPNSGLNWSESNADCSIATIDIDPGAPVVNRQELTCTLATLAATTGSFSVQVSSTVPTTYTQVPPSPSGTPLQIDGNLIDDGAGNDWATVGINCLTLTGCKIDMASGQQDDSFGQGTSEDSPVPSVVDGGIPPEKSDLLRFYIAKERFLSYDYLYLAWERVQEPNGTTNMDFELNQSSTPSSNGKTPVRTAGDILIKYDLSKGGVTPVLGYHRWVTAASALAQGLGSAAAACEATNKFPCWGKGTVLNNDVAGAINTASVDDPIVPLNADGTRTLDPRTFGEARINLQLSGIVDPNSCVTFAGAYLKSRSSDSFTAAIKDFIAPLSINLPTCQDVVIPNKAWASASNFTPAGGTLGGGISDTGEIKVLAPTASLFSVPAGVGLAQLTVFGLQVADATTAPSAAVPAMDEPLPGRRVTLQLVALAAQGATATTVFGHVGRAIQLE